MTRYVYCLLFHSSSKMYNQVMEISNFVLMSVLICRERKPRIFICGWNLFKGKLRCLHWMHHMLELAIMQEVLYFIFCISFFLFLLIWPLERMSLSIIVRLLSCELKTTVLKLRKSLRLQGKKLWTSTLPKPHYVEA